MYYEKHFLNNHTQNVVEKLVPYLFMKNLYRAYLQIKSAKFIQFDFIVCQVEGYQNTFKKSCRPFAFTSY